MADVPKTTGVPMTDEKFVDWAKARCQPSVSVFDKDICNVKVNFQISELPETIKSRWSSYFTSSRVPEKYVLSEVTVIESEVFIKFSSPGFYGWVRPNYLAAGFKDQYGRKSGETEHLISGGLYKSVEEAIVKQWEKLYFLEFRKPQPVKGFIRTSVFAPTSPFKIYTGTQKDKIPIESKDEIAKLNDERRTSVTEGLKVLDQILANPNSCFAHTRNYLPKKINVFFVDPADPDISILSAYANIDPNGKFDYIGLVMSYSARTFCHELGHILHRNLFVSTRPHDHKNKWQEQQTDIIAAFEEGFAQFVSSYSYTFDVSDDSGIWTVSETLWSRDVFKTLTWDKRLNNEYFVNSILYLLATAKEGNYDRVMATVLSPTFNLEDFFRKYIKDYPDQKPLVRKLIENLGLQAGEEFPEWIRE